MTAMNSIAVILLAAGQSTRFGPENKLLHLINNEPVVLHTAKVALSAGVEEVIVVAGHDAEAIEDALSGTTVRIVRNATPQTGMGTSLAAGANAVRSLPDAVMIMLGDMPMVKPETLQQVASKFDPDNGPDIIVPVHDGRRGHPVLFGARYLPMLCALTGDTGARAILRDHPERVRAVNVNDSGTLYDIDTQNDLSAPIASS